MTLTVLEPEGLYPDSELERRVLGPGVRVLQGAATSSLAEVPDAHCASLRIHSPRGTYPFHFEIVRIS